MSDWLSLKARALSEAEAKDKGERVSNQPLVSSTACRSLLSRPPFPPAKSRSTNSSNLTTRREGGRTWSIDSILIIHSFISQPLESSLHFNLIQEPGTKHRGLSLLHIHAKGDPHHSTFIKKLPSALPSCSNINNSTLSQLDPLVASSLLRCSSHHFAASSSTGLGFATIYLPTYIPSTAHQPAFPRSSASGLCFQPVPFARVA